MNRTFFEKTTWAQRKGAKKAEERRLPRRRRESTDVVVGTRAKETYNSNGAICIYYTNVRETRPRLFERVASRFNLSLSLSFSLARSVDRGRGALSSVFLTEADSRRMTVPRSHWISRLVGGIGSLVKPIVRIARARARDRGHPRNCTGAIRFPVPFTLAPPTANGGRISD